MDGPVPELQAESLRSHAVALRRLAWSLEERGELEQAISIQRRLLAVAPLDARAHQDLGLFLQRVGRREEAIAALRQTVQLDQDYAPGHCNLGLLLEECGDYAGAAISLRDAQRLQPQSEFIAYHLAAVSSLAGEPCDTPPQCPRDYLIQLFDGYAERFDRHLFDTLRYRGPELLAELVASVSDHDLPLKPWNVLDLGCGTGMTGVPFRETARQLVGVDLSPGMLSRAAQRVTSSGHRVYDELVQSDLVPALQARREHFDLILAADVFIYVGDLRTVFRAVDDALNAGGLFAFTIETWSGSEDYRLLTSRRYAHSPGYIARLAGEAGLDLFAQRSSDLRHGDDGRPVGGTVFLLRKPVASAAGITC